MFHYTNTTYSSFFVKKNQIRQFKCIRIGITLPRDRLYHYINKRVNKMLYKGLINEVLSLYPYKHLRPLNTIGYKEIFNFLNGRFLNFKYCVELIKKNTRNYAKRQLTWFNNTKNIIWFSPEKEKILNFILKKINI